MSLSNTTDVLSWLNMLYWYLCQLLLVSYGLCDMWRNPTMDLLGWLAWGLGGLKKISSIAKADQELVQLVLGPSKKKFRWKIFFFVFYSFMCIRNLFWRFLTSLILTMNALLLWAKFSCKFSPIVCVVVRIMQLRLWWGLFGFWYDWSIMHLGFTIAFLLEKSWFDILYL